jgi:hypothetical protein
MRIIVAKILEQLVVALDLLTASFVVDYQCLASPSCSRIPWTGTHDLSQLKEVPFKYGDSFEPSRMKSDENSSEQYRSED